MMTHDVKIGDVFRFVGDTPNYIWVLTHPGRAQRLANDGIHHAISFGFLETSHPVVILDIFTALKETNMKAPPSWLQNYIPDLFNDFECEYI